MCEVNNIMDLVAPFCWNFSCREIKDCDLGYIGCNNRECDYCSNNSKDEICVNYKEFEEGLEEYLQYLREENGKNV